jgi:cold shock protein
VSDQVVRESGTVKWFNNSLNFGFICRNNNKEDSIFVHYSQIQTEGYKTLQQNEVVTYQVEETPKGLAAINVIPQRLMQAK